MLREHYGGRGMETINDICWNAIGLANKPHALWVFLSSKESGGCLLIASNLLFLTSKTFSICWL